MQSEHRTDSWTALCGTAAILHRNYHQVKVQLVRGLPEVG